MRIVLEAVPVISERVSERVRRHVQDRTAFDVMWRAIHDPDKSPGSLARELLMRMDSDVIRWLGGVRIPRAQLREALRIRQEANLKGDL